MESPLDRVRRAFAEREADWASVAIAYATIAVGAGLIVYGVVAR